MSSDDTGQKVETLPPLAVPQRYNYIGVFLTLSCNLSCSYCINRFGQLCRSGRQLTAAEWVTGLNRLRTRADLPITLQGGEPTLHAGFFQIISGLRPEIQLDLLTNLQFDVERFMALVPPARLRRQAPYASIRISYHPETMDLAALRGKVLKLQARDYSVGVWAVDHPAWREEIEQAEVSCRQAGIDFRLKEFLGSHNGRDYGSYTYADAVGNKKNGPVECRTSELLIGPAGDLFRCHSDLYAGRGHYGNILDEGLLVEDIFRSCDQFGTCNPCDVKTKTDRFQKSGHTSVEIRFNREIS